MVVVMVVTLVLIFLGYNLASCKSTPQEQARELVAQSQEAIRDDNWKLANELLEQAASLDAVNPNIFQALGQTHQKLKNRPRAIVAFKRWAKLAPNDESPHRVLADLYRASGELALAVEQMQTAVNIAAKPDPLFMRDMVNIYCELGECRRAEDIVEQVLIKHPENEEVAALMATIQLALGNEKSAMQLVRFDTKNVTSPSVRVVRARYWFGRAKQKKALNELRLASENKSSELETTAFLARALMRQGQSSRAVVILQNILIKEPRNPSFRLDLAEAKIRNGDLVSAKSDTEAVLADYPQDYRGIYLNAWALEMLGDSNSLNQAVEGYRKAVEVDSERPEALVRLWRVYQKQGKLDDAISVLERLVQLGEALPNERLELADLMVQAQMRLDRAKDLLEAFLQEEPDSQRARNLLQKTVKE